MGFQSLITNSKWLSGVFSGLDPRKETQKFRQWKVIEWLWFFIEPCPAWLTKSLQVTVERPSMSSLCYTLLKVCLMSLCDLLVFWLWVGSVKFMLFLIWHGWLQHRRSVTLCCQEPLPGEEFPPIVIRSLLCTLLPDWSDFFDVLRVQRIDNMVRRDFSVHILSSHIT